MDRFATFLLFCTSLDLQPVCIDTQITRPTTSIGSRLEIIGLPGSSCEVGSICLVHVRIRHAALPSWCRNSCCSCYSPRACACCLCCISIVWWRTCLYLWVVTNPPVNLFSPTFCCYSKIFLNDKNPMLLFVCMVHSFTCL